MSVGIRFQDSIDLNAGVESELTRQAKSYLYENSEQISVYKASVLDSIEGKELFCAVTKSSFLEFSINGKDLSIIKYDLKEIYLLEEGSNPLILSLNIMTNLKLGIFKGSSKHEVTFQERQLLCSSEEDRFGLSVSIQALKREAWQREFEEMPVILYDSGVFHQRNTSESFSSERSSGLLIPPPEKYRRHFFIKDLFYSKQPKFDRILALSDRWIYCVDFSISPLSVKERKWTIPIEAIASITIETQSDESILLLDLIQSKAAALMDDEHAAKSILVPKRKYKVSFFNSRDLRDFCKELRIAHFSLLKKALSTYTDESCLDGFFSPHDSSQDDISGYLMKISKGGKGIPKKRFVKFYKAGSIQWGSKQDTKLEKVYSIETVIPELQKSSILTREEKSKCFALTTTGKKLVFMTANRAEYLIWINVIETAIANRSQE